MHRSILLIILITIALLGLTSCGSGATPPLASGQERHQETVDGMMIVLDSPSEPQINTTQQFRVTLMDSNGQPVDDASVYLDLEMNMLCLSDSHPIAEPLGDGGYTTASVYPMPGEWAVTVVARHNNEEQRAQFNIEVSE